MICGSRRTSYRRTLFLCVIVLLASLSVRPQDKYYYITGKVMDAKTALGLPGASVFCQNTTIGTVSKSDGGFSLRLANGGYDLIVSYTGYETRVLRISKGNKDNDSIVVELKEEDKSLSEVVVAGSAEVVDGWKKYGKFFLDNFIGTTPNAAQCTLENQEALKFYFYKKRNKLKVRATENLLITNNALGYKINYRLDSFVYEYNSNVGSYTGYPLFEELQGTDLQKDGWKKSRLLAYSGSRLHFIRSWYDSTLQEEGFVLEALENKIGNRMSAIKDPYDPKFYAVDSGDVVISMKGRLRVSYTNQVPDKKYLEEHRFPKGTQVEVSALDIADGLVIEENGYFYDQSDVTNIGYWSWEKLAELLPYEYLPE
jgi:hypothetical protein